MAVRSTMAALITRVRLLIGDQAGTSQVFADQDIQDILDESRVDVLNGSMRYEPTYSGATIQFLDYFTDLGGWEDGMLLKQYLTVVVTPSLIEPIAGHFQFAASTFPPVYITGKLYDVYRAAADVLERWVVQYTTRFDFTSDSQSFKLSQVTTQMEKRICNLRMKQRPGVITMRRSDLGGQADAARVLTGPTALDYMASG